MKFTLNLATLEQRIAACRCARCAFTFSRSGPKLKATHSGSDNQAPASELRAPP